MTRTCATCAKTLGPRNKTGYCIVCLNKARYLDPAFRAAQREGVRRKIACDPVYRESLRKRARAVTSNLDAEEIRHRTRYFRENRVWELGNACRPKGSEARKRAGRTITERRLAWCPRELRAEYLSLLRDKHIPAAEARAMIEAQHKLQMARWRRGIGAPAISDEELPVQPARIERIDPEKAAPFKPVPVVANMTLFDRAMAMTSNATQVSRSQMLSSARTRPVVRARWIVFTVLRDAGRSYPTIARLFRIRDHSTVMHGVRSAPDWARRDEDFGRALRCVTDACAPFAASARAALEAAA